MRSINWQSEHLKSVANVESLISGAGCILLYSVSSIRRIWDPCLLWLTDLNATCCCPPNHTNTVIYTESCLRFSVTSCICAMHTRVHQKQMIAFSQTDNCLVKTSQHVLQIRVAFIRGLSFTFNGYDYQSFNRRANSVECSSLLYDMHEYEILWKCISFIAIKILKYVTIPKL